MTLLDKIVYRNILYCTKMGGNLAYEPVWVQYDRDKMQCVIVLGHTVRRLAVFL